jgi:hypothetical protein
MVRFCKRSVSVFAILVSSWSAPIAAAQNPAPGETGSPAARTPRTADGRPDLSGLWMNTTRADGIELTLFPSAPAAQVQTDTQGNVSRFTSARRGRAENFERDSTLRRRADPNRPIYKPEFWQKVRALNDDGNAADPGFNCMALGVPRMGPPSKIVQTPKEMIFLYASKNIFRLIPTDGRPHDPIKSGDPTLMGDSVAHWEGDTLVIDVIGFVDTSWLDKPGYFHSHDMRVTERLRREGDTIYYQATVEDPAVLEKPWVMNEIVLQLNSDPNETLWEDPPCIERDLEHLVTKEHH